MAKILIVDDDAEMVESTRTLLEADGYKVVAAPHGDAGYAKAREEKPDLILLDVMMQTDREGFEIAQKLKADEATRHIPVIIITGIRRAKQLPFKYEPDDDWLPVKAVLEKPVQPDILLRTLKQAMGGK